MVGEDHGNVVQLHEHIDSVHEFAYLCVGVLFTIKEVDDGVDHDDVWFVECNLIAERLDVLIFHQVLAQPPADDQVVVPHANEVIVPCEPLVVGFDTALQELCNDLCLEPHHLEWAIERHIHEIGACCCTCGECTQPV